MGALNAFPTYDILSLRWVYRDISHNRLRSICMGTRGTERREKGGKVRDETWLFPRSGPKGQHKATCLYHLIQEITTQTFKSVRNQKHPCSDFGESKSHPALETPVQEPSAPAGPLCPALRGRPLLNIRPQLQCHLLRKAFQAALLTAVSHSLSRHPSWRLCTLCCCLSTMDENAMRPGTWACHDQGRAPSAQLAPGPWPTLNVS